MAVYGRTVAALAAVILLSACLVTPGRFTSTLDIRADRSFAFTYKGEIIASDIGGQGVSSEGSGADGQPTDAIMPEDQDGILHQAALWLAQDRPAGGKPGAAEEDFGKKGEDAKMQAIAAALAKEKGFRSARYIGDSKFEIDYAIAGRLDHAFLFPFNIDAQIALPFVAVELRGEDRVRVKAPGYANSDRVQGPMMGGGGPNEAVSQALNGTFTLTTDAEIVSQNEEDGAIDVTGGKKIVWTVTPLTSEMPMATLRLKP